jgi:lipopolysaccharide transport system ATP-binding protein
MSSDIAISVSGLGKCYRIYDNPSDRLKQAILARTPKFAARRFGGAAGNREFWALRDIDFEVHRGETFGIVGRNGSGKSTLLQIIAGTLSPTLGSAIAHGRLAALLELGSGFNPEFTGLENVRLNAELLGLSPAEIDRRLDAILSFADIGDFIHRPVKTYSSGMTVRLAFAVQAQIDPDVLIVDEALAVGDAKFQAKCFARLDALKENGTSILFVSHSTDQIVTHCDRALLLHDGKVRNQGAPKQVVHSYLELLFGAQKRPASFNSKAGGDADSAGALATSAPADEAESTSTAGNRFVARPGYNPYEFRWGDGAATIEDYCLTGPGGEVKGPVECGSPLRLTLGIAFHRDVIKPILGLTIKTTDGVTVFGTNSELNLDQVGAITGEAGSRWITTFAFTCRLGPGDYFVSLGIASRNGDDVVPHDRRYDSIHLNMIGDGFFGLAMLDAAQISRKAP